MRALVVLALAAGLLVAAPVAVPGILPIVLGEGDPLAQEAAGARPICVSVSLSPPDVSVYPCPAGSGG